MQAWRALVSLPCSARMFRSDWYNVIVFIAMVPIPLARAFFSNGSTPCVRKLAPMRMISKRLLSMPQPISSSIFCPWLDAPVNRIFFSRFASSQAS